MLSVHKDWQTGLDCTLNFPTQAVGITTARHLFRRSFQCFGRIWISWDTSVVEKWNCVTNDQFPERAEAYFEHNCH